MLTGQSITPLLSIFYFGALLIGECQEIVTSRYHCREVPGTLRAFFLGRVGGGALGGWLEVLQSSAR